MSDQQVRVVFQPLGRAVHVLPGTKVVEAAALAGLTIDTPCGGAGLCGKCRVQIAGGAGEPNAAERRVFSRSQLEDGWRLACQSVVTKESVIQIPQTSIFGDQHQILTESHTAAAAEIRPAIRKIYIEMPAPTMEDGRPDLLRMEQFVGEFKADLQTLRAVSGRISRAGYKGTAVLVDHRLIDFEEGDTSAQCYGVAFDIGTTTLVGSLMDLRTGEELGIVSAMNPQVSFGDDVVSRIKYSSAGGEALEEVRNSIIQVVGAMICDLAAQAGIGSRNIYEASFAGNTTMQHLLCGLDVEQLGVSPFAPPCGKGLLVSAAELGLPIHPRASAYIFPVIGGFVGGDTVAGMLSSKLLAHDSPSLMVDIGTNGEIVLLVDGKLYAASTAAGPAFEGARIFCGMRASAGAIEKVILNADVHLEVIGDAAPIGICGSGLIDAAAELLRNRMVSPEGRMLPPEELPADLAPALRGRMKLDDSGATSFLLHGGDGGRPNVVLTQRDIRELQLASGAIRAGISILCKQAGLRPGDLKVVLVAGGFGSYIRRENAQRIGLLPADIEPSRIHYVGNTSLSGARWALLSTKARDEAQGLANITRHVELSQDMGFQMEFAEAMIFPEMA